ncbi:hypothetical protein [Flaviflexus massiliensis]|uniref:hypothetical protein n=1 Tax=Flaviflexus massiliensis TaxID=1522309 RepID=UPI0006D5487F|nr:hypothetical protein [Flaviflexus massiliensis]
MSANSKRYVILTPFKKADVLAGLCKLHGLDVWVVPSKAGAMIVHDLPVPVFDDWDISELLGGVSAEGVSESGQPNDNAADGALETPETAAFETDAREDDPATDKNTAPETGDEDGADQDSAEDADEDSQQLDANDQHAVAKRLARLSRAGVIVLTSELGEDVGNEVGVSGLVTALTYDSKGNATDTPAGLIVATGEPILEDLLLGSTNPQDAKGAIQSGSIKSDFLEGLAHGKRDAGQVMPPRKPRRFFGKDPK